MIKVLITRKIPQRGIQLLEEAGYKLTIYTEKRSLPQKELIELCKKNDALLSAGSNKLNAHFFEECSHLQAVALMSVGYDNVDVEAASSYKIPVSNTPDVLSNATSDIAFLLMLAVSRNAFQMHKRIERGGWSFFEPTANLGIELKGKTLGVFGLGRIGVDFAKKQKEAYEMNVNYNNRNRNTEAEGILDAKFVSFDQLLAESDVLSVHANLSNETKNLFNKSAFEKMKRSALFINTARGGLHNEQDLINAIQHKTIWGAGLDVTNPEPMDKDNPLLNLPNVCVLPHIGSATEETRDKMAIMAAENLLAALSNKVMPQIINREVYNSNH